MFPPVLSSFTYFVSSFSELCSPHLCPLVLTSHPEKHVFLCNLFCRNDWFINLGGLFQMEYVVKFLTCPMVSFLVASLWLLCFSFYIPVAFLCKYCAGLWCLLFILEGSKIFPDQVLIENVCGGGVSIIFQANWGFLTWACGEVHTAITSLQLWGYSRSKVSLLFCCYRDRFLKI